MRRRLDGPVGTAPRLLGEVSTPAVENVVLGNPISASADASFHIARVGLNYRF
jgi:hypothetical protein